MEFTFYKVIVCRLVEVPRVLHKLESLEKWHFLLTCHYHARAAGTPGAD